MERNANAKELTTRFCAAVLTLCVGLMSIVQPAMAALPGWGEGTESVTGAQRLTFQCPKAYLGIREDLLPTHWEVLKGRTVLHLKSSQVQGQSMVCVYGRGGRQPMVVGTVHRLVPQGYKCISDGVGNFKCQRRR